MKVVVYWENPGEKVIAERLSKAIGSLLKSVMSTIVRDLGVSMPRLRITTGSLTMDGAPFTYPAETLAEQAKRLLDEQEAAFGEKVSFTPPWVKRDVETMAANTAVPPAMVRFDVQDNSGRRFTLADIELMTKPKPFLPGAS